MVQFLNHSSLKHFLIYVFSSYLIRAATENILCYVNVSSKGKKHSGRWEVGESPAFSDGKDFWGDLLITELGFIPHCRTRFFPSKLSWMVDMNVGYFQYRFR